MSLHDARIPNEVYVDPIKVPGVETVVTVGSDIQSHLNGTTRVEASLGLEKKESQGGQYCTNQI
jgi:hypothetical protein